MQPINALSLAPDGNDWLANSRRPRILHVFDHACNLINERRRILSIVTLQIGNGPFNLVLEDDVSFFDHLNAQSSISICANQLILDDLTINTKGGKLWSPCPDWEMLHTNRDNILSYILSLRGVPFAMALPFTNYQSLISNLSTALAVADISSSLTITSQLAGLGIGLTPSGDDFILGAILAAWIIHPTRVARVLAEETANTAAPLTTSLSAAWLRSAGRGEAGILWHNFFNALIIGNSSAIQLQITKLLSMGHTSGADALAGFMGVFISFKENIINP